MLGAAVTWNISNVGAIAGVMGASYGVSLAAVGLLTTGLFVTHLAVQIPGGRLIDRVGARRDRARLARGRRSGERRLRCSIRRSSSASRRGC